VSGAGVSAGRTVRARQLRRHVTPAEYRLWYFLKNRGLAGYKFVRQLPVGPYFADFACRELCLIVEIDGGQHNESQSDAIRTAHLNREGYAVLRFWNNEVLSHPLAVLQAIADVADGMPSPGLRYAPATLSPTGRGTRGEHAARADLAARIANETPTFPLPVGERSPRSGG